jgi:hypothetical protein
MTSAGDWRLSSGCARGLEILGVRPVSPPQPSLAEYLTVKAEGAAA